MKHRRLLGALCAALLGCAALLPRIAARSNTQVHRINQR
jgi:hypothetical protein